jgi:hypothetical protein
MANRTIRESSAISAVSLAYAALSTDARPVTPDLVARLPRIHDQLEELDEILQHEISVAYERVATEDELKDQSVRRGKLVWDMKDIAPYGPHEHLTQCWHRLLAASDSPDALRLADLYYSQSQIHADAIPIEAYCYAADINPLRVIEWLTAVLVRQGVTASTLLAAKWHPRVVEKTIEVALTDGGTAERQMLHRATGFTPLPKGAQTIIQVNATQAAARTVTAPAPEATIGLLGNAFTEARGVPLPPIPAALDVTDAELVEDDEDPDEAE